MNPRRKIRIESLLKREIATCLLQEVRDPRLGFITVTRCVFDDENRSVTAYYTVLGGAGDRNLTARCLAEMRGFVQRFYAKAIGLRFVPTLHFAYDEQEVRRRDIDDLIRQARASDPDHDGAGDNADAATPEADES